MRVAPVRAQCTDSSRHAGQPAEHLPYVCLNLGGEIITAGRETERNLHGMHQAVDVLLRRQFQFQLDRDRTQTDSIKEQAAVTASSGSSPTLFSARVMSSCTVSKFKSAVFSMMAETMARLPCRKLGFAADDRRVAGRR